MSDDLEAAIGDVVGDQPAPAPPVLQSTAERENPTKNTDQELSREGYAWAADCFWVYKRLGGKVTKAEAGPGRWALWTEAKRDVSNFVSQIMPKAMTLLEKARDKAGDSDVVDREERKSIAALQDLLKAAVEEAKAAG